MNGKSSVKISRNNQRYIFKRVLIAFYSLLLTLTTFGVVHGQESPGAFLTPDPGKSIGLELECHSGTPLILEYVLSDKEKIVEKLFFDFDDDGVADLALDPIEQNGEEGAVVFRGVPYRREGKYRSTIYLKTRSGTHARSYIVSFNDFIWGRDNFNFANDGKFEDTIDFVSKTLIEWAEERFGPLTRDQQVILLYVMYSIYKGSIGRCYGFTGGEIYYMENPQRLPFGCAGTYDIPEGDERIIREMDFVQNDIVFSNYLLKGVDLTRKQDSEAFLKELEKVKRSIDRGRNIILGYVSPKMHHSMVAYGYIENQFKGSTTLVVANNWEREQMSNTFSEDAENLVFASSDEGVKVTWYDLTKKEVRYPEMIFAIEREDRYSLEREGFLALLARTEERIRKKGKIILMVEETEVAYVIDGDGKKRGYKKPRYFKDTEEIDFRKIDYNYVFELPADGEYRLLLKNPRYNEERGRYKDVNLYGIFPADIVSADILSADLVSADLLSADIVSAETHVLTVMNRGLPVNDEYISEYRIDKSGIERVTE
jgi:hypothetical protein